MIEHAIPIHTLSENKSKVFFFENYLTEAKISFVLKLSLAIVFIWFGMLKVAHVSPVIPFLQNSYTFLAQSPFFELLGLAEIAIGVGLIVDRLAKFAAILMVFHLLGTLSVVFIAPKMIFGASFPLLTLEGEFLAKNLVLITAALSVYRSRQK